MSDEIDIQRTSTNRLVHEKSPYLLQHADNPVDWYPWCEEAFEKAERKDKPIFLSIGYATCHWCHVMAHESFEDDNVATLLNKKFIAIKVDREERPDIDTIYMSVCQALTGQGGWPLSVFLTPEGKPFFAGTYFPKLSRMGMPGFMDILKQLANMWQSERGKINQASEQIMNAIQPKAGNDSNLDIIGPDILNKGYLQLYSRFDTKWGGFGEKPKFPTPHNLSFLFRYYLRSNEKNALNMAEMTLKAMRNGGIFDHVGFGFHRYSVDERWMVPHFEKMLYDQALLAIANIEAYQVTGETRYADIIDEIFTYVLRDMTSSKGGFYSAEDADSEGKEGTFYIWKPETIIGHLGEEDGGLFCRYFDVKEGGNFEEGLSIPNISISSEVFADKEGVDPEEFMASLEKMRKKLFHVRERREHPLKDDKILTSWNGLMIAALSKGYKATENQDYLAASKNAADCILKNLKDKEGRLLRRYREGDAAFAAYLEDYAFLVWGLVELYEATFEVQYLEEALILNQEMIDRFWDSDNGGFYFSGKGNEQLITKTKEIYDGALPSGNSVAALNLMRLGRITGDLDLEKKAEKIVIHFSKQVREVPMAHTQLLSAIDFMVGPSREIVVVGDPDLETTRDMISLIRRKFIPNKVLIFLPTGNESERMCTLAPFLKDMKPMANLPSVYICEQYSCKQPITKISDLEKALA